MSGDESVSENIKETELLKNIEIMEVVEKELNRRKKESTFCFSMFVACLSIWVLLVKLWELYGEPLATKHMTVGVELIAIIMLVIILSQTSLRIQDMGVTKKNLKPALLRAFIICAVFTGVMIGYKTLSQPGETLFDWSKPDWRYAMTAVLQEFLSRGFLLTCLINIYESKARVHLAVIVSSLLFTTLHLYMGFFFMLGAGLLSVLLGYVYVKDRNIWGVSIIHFTLGTVGVMLHLV